MKKSVYQNHLLAVGISSLPLSPSFPPPRSVASIFHFSLCFPPSIIIYFHLFQAFILLSFTPFLYYLPPPPFPSLFPPITSSFISLSFLPHYRFPLFSLTPVISSVISLYFNYIHSFLPSLLFLLLP